MSDPLIYSNRVTVSVYSANSADADFPASNLGLLAVGHEWRSTTTGSLVRVVFDVGVETPTVRAIHLNRVNFASATVKRGDSDPPGTTVGTIESAVDRRGIRRATLAVNASNRFWSVEIAAGTPTDNAAFWRIGSAFLWDTVQSFPGLRVNSDLRHTQGGIVQITPREDEIRNTTGPVRAAWTGTILDRRSADSVMLVERLAQDGIVLVDPGIGDEWLFPSRSYALSTRLQVDAITEQASVEVKEVA